MAAQHFVPCSNPSAWCRRLPASRKCSPTPMRAPSRSPHPLLTLPRSCWHVTTQCVSWTTRSTPRAPMPTATHELGASPTLWRASPSHMPSPFPRSRQAGPSRSDTMTSLGHASRPRSAPARRQKVIPGEMSCVEAEACLGAKVADQFKQCSKAPPLLCITPHLTPHAAA